MTDAKRDNNYIPVILGTSSSDGITPMPPYVDPSTHRLLVDVTGGFGSSATDDAAFAVGVDSYNLTGGIYKSVLDSVDDGDGGAFHMTVKRAIHVNLRDASGNEVSVSGASMVDDSAFTPGTTSISPMGAFFDDAAPDSVNEGDGGVVRMSANRNLYVTLRDAAGNERGLNIDASGQMAVTIASTTSITPGTAAANLGKAEDAGHTTGDTGVMTLAVRADAGATGNPTALATTSLDYIPLATDANNRLYVNVAGDIAHDTADSTSAPVKVGGQARTTNPTAVADADRANFITDKLGKQVVVGSIRDLKVNQVTTITTSASETTVLTAVASTFLDVYGCIVTNTSATAVTVAFKDSTAGTTQFNIAVPAGETRGFMLPESGAMKQTTVNNNWTATTQSVTSVIITMLAVKNI